MSGAMTTAPTAAVWQAIAAVQDCVPADHGWPGCWGLAGLLRDQALILESSGHYLVRDNDLRWLIALVRPGPLGVTVPVTVGCTGLAGGLPVIGTGATQAAFDNA